jgi:hypothetical protein
MKARNKSHVMVPADTPEPKLYSSNNTLVQMVGKMMVWEIRKVNERAGNEIRFPQKASFDLIPSMMKYIQIIFKNSVIWPKNTAYPL